jgi:hypothetical protein
MRINTLYKQNDLIIVTIIKSMVAWLNNWNRDSHGLQIINLPILAWCGENKNQFQYIAQKETTHTHLEFHV